MRLCIFPPNCHSFSGCQHKQRSLYLSLHLLTLISAAVTCRRETHQRKCFCLFFNMNVLLQVRALLEEITEKLPEEFNMAELLARAEERTPYQVVALQECERMNVLTQEIRRSLRELSLGLKVIHLVSSDSNTIYLPYLCLVSKLKPLDYVYYTNILSHMLLVYIMAHCKEKNNIMLS